MATEETAPSPQHEGDEPIDLTVTVRDLQQSGTTDLAVTMPDGVPVELKPPRIDDLDIASRLDQRHGLTSSPSLRYEVRESIGQGATSRIFTIFDRSLQRTVALKALLHSNEATLNRAKRFIHEASVAARLDHPNVPPIYDVGLGADGDAFYTMKQVAGRTLGSTIEDWLNGAVPLPPLSQRIGIILQIANALEAAHAQEVIHRDIKPDNVMLGNFGEVFLVDWGTAHQPSDEPTAGRRVGTPLFMSPQAARGESPKISDDVFSLGATLFSLLLLRTPLVPDEPERFWRRKALGEMDPLTPEERRLVPAPLLAIALKGLQADPAQRYPTVKQLRLDLEAWLAGEAVSAWRESRWERLSRWHRRYGRTFWQSAAVVGVLLTLLALLYGERLKRVATWGSPVIHETFVDDSWRDRWTVNGAVVQQNGSLVTDSDEATLVRLRQRLDGPIAIEYTGEILQGAPPCDLSFTFRPFTPDDEEALDAATPIEYLVQIGAYDGAYSAIIARSKSFFQHLAYSDFRPQAGHRYRIRIEIAGKDIRASVDGRQILDFQTLVPFTGGFISLYGYYRGKSFSDIRIYSLGIPQQVSATAVGDALATIPDPQRAREQYRLVAERHAGTPLGDEARYKEGICCEQLGEHQAADAAWGTISSRSWQHLARLAAVERLVSTGDDRTAQAELETLYREGDEDVRKRIQLSWNRWVTSMFEPKRLDGWISFRDRLFPDALVTEYNAANLLLQLQRYDEVLQRFPGQPNPAIMALQRLGRHAEIPERYPDSRWMAGLALFDTGRSSEIAARYPEQRNTIMWGLFARGEVTQSLAMARPGENGRIRLYLGDFDSPDLDKEQRVISLLFQHRPEEALTAAGNDPNRALCLLMLGRSKEIGDDILRDFPDRIAQEVRFHRALESFIDGDSSRMPSLIGDHLQAKKTGVDDWYRHRHILFPAALALQGDPTAWKAWLPVLAERRWDQQQHAWHDARYLLGQMDEATYLNQPHRLYAAPDLLLLRAIRSDLAGDHDRAAIDYRSWQTYPAWQRSNDAEPTIERFVNWRLGKR